MHTNVRRYGRSSGAIQHQQWQRQYAVHMHFDRISRPAANLTVLLTPCCVLLCLVLFALQRQAAMAQWKLIPLGLIAGVFGSLADSLLGAALQFTGYNSDTASLSSAPGPGVSRISGWFSHKWISDNVINVLAGSLTAVLTALAALRMFG